MSRVYKPEPFTQALIKYRVQQGDNAYPPNINFPFLGYRDYRGYDYTRTPNPTRKALEESMASLEGGAGAIAAAAELAAIATLLP